MQVKALERFYGVSLFHRRGRRVQLTDAGAELLALTHRMSALEGEAEELLSATGNMRHGRLKVAADGPYHVIEIIASYRARFPAVRVTIDIANSDTLRRSLIAYESDVAVLPCILLTGRSYGACHFIAFCATNSPRLRC